MSSGTMVPQARVEIISNLRSKLLDPCAMARQRRDALSCARTPQGNRSAVAAITLDFLASPLRHDRELCTGEIRIGDVRNFPART